MQTLKLLNQCVIPDSFRVSQARGIFDVPFEHESVFSVEVDTPGLDEDWQIGAVVGPSGTGKSTWIREILKQQRWPGSVCVDQWPWPEEQSLLDGFDQKLQGRDIFHALNAVGFSSVPAWLRPWRTLSNGEQFRCDLARSLMLDAPVVMVDEFTSVVDRQVAQFGSAAVAKAIRNKRARCERFVAVTCHYDVLEWLSPDWWIDMSSGRLARGCLQRPEIQLQLERCRREWWELFKRHHYLTGKLGSNPRCYLLRWEGKPVGFMATLPVRGKKKARIAHRLVVLPDYQGMGIGKQLLNEVARAEVSEGKRFSLVSSHPAMISSLERDPAWRRQQFKKLNRGQVCDGKRYGGVGRMLASYLYLGPEPVEVT